MATWDDIKAAWSASWSTFYDDATSKLGPLLQADVSGYLGKIQDSMNGLFAARSNLDQAKAKLPQLGLAPEDAELRERYTIMEHRYHIVAAGIYTDATSATDATGAGPLVVIAGIALGVAACAWAVSAWEYFANLRDQTKLLDNDLAARIWAMKNNATLPPPNVAPLPGNQVPDKPKPDPPDDGSMLGWLLLGGLALTAAALALPAITKKG